jgi:GNAT superfamily N-acetyltransferase
MKVRLRPATSADAPALVHLLHELGYAGTESFIAGRLRQLAAHPDGLVQVAEVERVALGFISLHFIPQLALAGDFCRVSYLCVADHARGSGIGAQLLAFAEAQARARGCDRMELHSHERRVDAHRFYTREGYVESPKYLVRML